MWKQAERTTGCREGREERKGADGVRGGAEKGREIIMGVCVCIGACFSDPPPPTDAFFSDL